jgi:hypothetical protein
MTKRPFDKLDPELLKAMEQERRHALAWEPYREKERMCAEFADVGFYYAVWAKFQAGFVRSEVVAWLRAAADRIEQVGLRDGPPTEFEPPPSDQEA